MPPRKSTRKSTTRRSSTQKGRGIVGDIHNFVRDNQLISKGVRLAGRPEMADTIAQVGYGRRKKRATKKSTVRTVVMAVPVKRRATRRKTQRGRGLFDALGGLLGSVGHGVGSAGYGLLSGLTGSGRKGSVRKVIAI